MSVSNSRSGSQWRRWDLHVHTPCSGGTDFGDSGLDSTWERYAAGVCEAIDRHEIRAICLADYFTLNGYAELIRRGIYDPQRQRWVAGAESRDLVVLPGVELRLAQITGENNAINLHVIFDPSRLDVDRLTSDFLARLPLDPLHSGQTVYASRENILALGKHVRDGRPLDLNQRLTSLPSAEQDALWNHAISRASVAQPSLLQTLRNIDSSTSGGRCYLLAYAASGHGGLDELDWQGHAGTIRQSALYDADLLFSSSDKTRRFLLGQHAATPAIECIQRFGRLKPCVWGSDSKRYEALLHPSDGHTNKYTWIKADLTFEGLKQVVYEPESRVVVQESEPISRPWNTVIDAVRFLDDSRTGIASEEWIPINQSLTAIIGGKSSGKSLLLHLVAKTIDSAQVQERYGVDRRPYDGLEQDLGFEVRWRNGDVQTLSGVEAAPSRITYLPQSYINQLAEPESQDQLEDVILRLLKEDESFRSAESDLRDRVDQHRSAVTAQTRKLFELKRQIREASERIAELGNDSAIVAEIARLQAEHSEILKAAGMSSDDEAAFAKLMARREEVEASRRSAASRGGLVVETTSEVRRLQTAVLSDIDAIQPRRGIGQEESYVPEELTEALAILRKDIFEAFGKASTSMEATGQKAWGIDAALQVELSQIEASLEPFRAKLASRERAVALLDAEKRQKALLDQVREEQQRRERLQLRLAEALNRVRGDYRRLHDLYQTFIEQHLDGGEIEIASDVKLLASLRFDTERFAQGLQEVLDGRQRNDSVAALSNLADGYRFAGVDAHVDAVSAFLAQLVAPDDERSIRLRKAFSPEHAAAELLRDHFRLRLSLEHAGDNLHRMSPGKRGMILLRLLLEKSDATHPILIDQPEDNLDNRTVFSQLRTAIRERKSQRQILLVTHNANLVVSTDAECVIVAHQYGPGERVEGLPRFEYRGGALEHSELPTNSASIVERQGTREHVCEILEGGERAFKDRQEKYEFA